MGYVVTHKRIREHYSPTPNAAEARHRLYVLEQPCFGCGRAADHAHHTLLKFPAKRWRRDHRCLLPVCQPCHTDIHDRYGDEAVWIEWHGRENWEAVAEMERLWAESELIERMSGGR